MRTRTSGGSWSDGIDKKVRVSNAVGKLAIKKGPSEACLIEEQNAKELPDERLSSTLQKQRGCKGSIDNEQEQ